MTLHVSDTMLVPVYWSGPQYPDSTITVTLERPRLRSCIHERSVADTATVVFRSSTGIDGWRAQGVWFVLDKERTEKSVLVRLMLGSVGFRAYLERPFWQQRFGGTWDWSVVEWAEKHLDFAIRPYYSDAQLYPGEQFITGGRLYVVLVRDKKHLYRSDMREGAYVEDWIVSKVEANITDSGKVLS